AKSLIEALRRLDLQSITVQDVGLHRPTLDDVFLALTGHAAEDTPDDGDAQTGARP
ncbi:MAG: daunorubicin/doxorubicin resistance ABC transporter ATP-binding protein DrrA, partial [Pseudonocardiaceae bacterium]